MKPKDHVTETKRPPLADTPDSCSRRRDGGAKVAGSRPGRRKPGRLDRCPSSPNLEQLSVQQVDEEQLRPHPESYLRSIFIRGRNQTLSGRWRRERTSWFCRGRGRDSRLGRVKLLVGGRGERGRREVQNKGGVSLSSQLEVIIRLL